MEADHHARHRPGTSRQELAARVQRKRMFGSAAIDLAWVADGKIDANIMLSNNPWDTAAGVVIAREARATVIDLDGSPHNMTARATIAASPKLIADLVELISEAREATRHSQHTAEQLL
ncbi:inositol monophosphatase family protein [Nonomuraea sp. JJY05]|uniref:inositol monophosphatase family protein n=1 Tax=Nonomuraea sp. JJY05 TaxID=3350255 RepID=UPI00373DF796